ncbi:ATP-binding protein [Streptomyces sp. NPDC093598]|uniref:BbrUII/HgiDII family restriction enzyme n=1 Tax=Streptomyces sp. NPDC093598 TaxID=3366046 RepID=UPI003806EE81
METNSPYKMSVSLNVVTHLGLNLYSNIPAVLSEAVANAWDAEASKVTVDIDKAAGAVVVHDDGSGMDLGDINDKYLTVGYRRRDDTGTLTPNLGRPVMGRKGIGKLSLFSIARTVEIYTVKDNHKHAFRMSLDDIKAAITDEAGSDSPYRPSPLDTTDIDFAHGTKIVLRDLKKNLNQAEFALKKRLARRFSVIGPEFGFELEVNGQPVSVSDRAYFHKLQYIWLYGDESYTERVRSLAINAEQVEIRPSVTEKGGKVFGWIGTVHSSDQLREQGENLNKVVVLARGRLAHEDILENISDSSFYRQYVIGEFNADFLDSDTEEDITTSSRQRLDEDDPRFIDLREFFEGEMGNVKKAWGDWRDTKGVQVAAENTAIDEWFKSLGLESQKRARKLFGTINSLAIDDPGKKKELFAHSVMAFESLRYKDNLQALEEMTRPALEGFISVFNTVDEIESALYHRIVNQRLEVIEKMQAETDADSKEKILQELLFQHLWLLDPSWERATDAHLEERIGKTFDDVALTDEEKKSRIDIRYKRLSGAHVIIELKRYSVVTDTYTLARQVRKYRDALRRALKDRGEANPHIEIVCIVGKSLSDWAQEDGRAESAQTLGPINARVMTYDELLDNARGLYSEYLRGREGLDRVRKVIESLEP